MKILVVRLLDLHVIAFNNKKRNNVLCIILITSQKLHKAYQTNARLVYSSRSYYTTTSNPLFSQSVRFSSLSFRSRYTMARFSFYYPNIMRPPKSILILNLFQFHQTVLLLVNANLYFTQKSLICRLNG